MLLVLALVLGVGGFGARALLGDALASGKKHPTAWDARVLPFVKIAEKERGLGFLHPVEVRFLPPAKFKKTVTADEKELDEGDREEIEQATGMLRAIGLLSGDVDLFKATNDLAGGGILAYYSLEDQAITVRGMKVTPSIRATLVHELTHALQDQHFEIGKRTTRLEKSDSPTASTENSMLDGIIEGDAERVASRYVRALSPQQRRLVAKGQEAENATAGAAFKKVPQVLVAMMSSPYVLGEALVTVAAEDGGNRQVDDLFEDTPKHETALLDPLRILTGDVDALAVDAPGLEKGEKEIDRGEFGSLTWYFMLAERLPVTTALRSADGWGGDAYVAFSRKGTSCVRADYRGATPGDTAQMRSSLQRWIAAAPGSPASVTFNGKVVRFESCDPGKAARGVGKERSLEAQSLLTLRAGLGIGMMRNKLPSRIARCYADRLVQQYPVAKLSDPAFGKNDPAVQVRFRELLDSCR